MIPGKLLLWLRANWLPLAAAAAIVAAVWYIDHRGFKRAEEQAQLRAVAAEVVARRRQQDEERRMVAAISAIDASLADRLAMIRTLRTTVIQPTITKETADAPRYRDPDCALTPGVFDALRRAIGASDSTAAGNGGVTVPIAPAAP